jgi:hypothetical protein
MSAATELEAAVAAVEQRLGALGHALRSHQAEAVEAEALGLQRALAAAVDQLRRGTRSGALPPPLRRRLALASGHVAAHRESLARATAALDRAIDVLLPGSAMAGGYTAGGRADRAPHSGRASA